MRLKDKVAIVTGGAKGIGKATCERFAKEGARVVVADIADERDAVAKALGNGSFAVHFDSTKAESIDALVSTVVSQAGGIDILMNNAAIFNLAPVLEVTREDWHRQFGVNVEGLFFTLQAVARSMIEQKRKGRIINLASQAGRRGEPLVTVYCATKAAVISITQSTGLALIKHGINVNAIAPGVVDTPMWAQVDALFGKYEGLPVGEKKRIVGENVPYGRFGKPEEIAAMAAFLASDDAEYIVAQTYGVDGGNWLA
ncbi:MAG: L-iditol 2-dehydrogenase [Geminicoccaceae bacterium]